MTLVEDKILMRPRETAEALGLGLSKTYQLLATGKLPSIRVGRSIRVPVDALNAWVKTAQQEQVDE